MGLGWSLELRISNKSWIFNWDLAKNQEWVGNWIYTSPPAPSLSPPPPTLPFRALNSALLGSSLSCATA